MSEVLKIRLAARCEAAGRPENEDNFQVAEDLSVSNTGFTTDKIFPLGAKGTLLLVCDGMGGMNAGEVASAVGVETIKNLFASQYLTEDVLASDENICAYMKRAIVKADSRIKEEASKDAEKKGMGSTAVMAWLLGQKVYVAWCGDSRCYRYNPSIGLEQLSHDHSYVQDLVDTGQLSADLAFDHPNKNIITRSLGDPRGAAKPDAKVYDLHVGDVILLCSDGLSDSLRDNEIEQAISRSLDSMEVCKDALWKDSKHAGWHDNVTIVLAQVVDEKLLQQEKQQPHAQSKIESPKQQELAQQGQPAQAKAGKKSKKAMIALVSAIVVISALIGVSLPRILKKDSAPQRVDICYQFILNRCDKIKKDADFEYTPQVMDSLLTLKSMDEAKYNELKGSVEKALTELRHLFDKPEFANVELHQDSIKLYQDSIDKWIGSLK